MDDANAKVLTNRADAEQVKARVEKARVMVPSGNTQTPAVAAAQAVLSQAQLDLERARVFAPQSGWVVNKTLTVGTTVNPGQTLFAIIADRSFWIDANFKETELPGVHVGQAVEIRLDLYPDHPFGGKVESIGGGTGTAFSLLPQIGRAHV